MDNYYEASLIVQCNGLNKTDPWSYIKGMDLSAHQVNAKIVRLEVRYCPPVTDVSIFEIITSFHVLNYDHYRTYDNVIFIFPG